MKCLVVATTLTTIILAVHLTEVRCRPDRIQACGKDLADILQKKCLGGYNTYYQSNADENLSNGMRPKRGITQECCLQSCAFKELMQYCSGDPPINVTELLPTDPLSRPDGIKKPRQQMKLLSNNKIDIEYEEDSNDGSSNTPSMPPPPRLDQGAKPADKVPRFQEPQENLTPMSSGVHSTTPWFRGKTPAIVLVIGKKFDFGYRSQSKIAF